MTTYEESLLAARFAALAPEPLAGDWDEVLDRAGTARNRRSRVERSHVHQGRRRLLVALVAVAIVAAVTTAAWGLVRVLVLDRGFVGLPPIGASPSAPESGALVLSFNGRSATLPLYLGKADRNPIGHPMTHVFVYADGRIIWQREGWVPAGANDGLSGFLEQRLTAEGVELLRSQVLSTGLFRKDLALVSHVQGWGAIQARNHGVLVTLRWIWADQRGWGPTNPFPGDLGNYRFTAATPEQDRALLRLDALLDDPGASLPASAWHDRRIRAYVPSRYAVCWQHRPEQGPDNPPPSIAPARILPLLPHAVADLLRRRGVVPWNGIPSRACSIVPTAEARTVAQALDDAGLKEGVVGNGIDARLGGLTYRLEAPGGLPGHVYVWFEPTLPDGEWVGTGG